VIRVQVAQLYLALWMAGGVLALGSLLVGNFGRRAGAAFSPSAWVSAGAAGLSLSGAAGTCSLGVGAWIDGQLDSLGPCLAAGLGAGLWVAWLQRRAAQAPGGLPAGLDGSP